MPSTETWEGQTDDTKVIQRGGSPNSPVKTLTLEEVCVISLTVWGC